MNVRLFKDSDAPSWERYVSKSSCATCYHQLGWKDVVESAFGHQTYYLLSVGDKGEVSGILPLVHMRSWLFGNYMVSLPFWNYGGICADNNQVASSLLEEAIILARSKGARHLELRHEDRQDWGLEEKVAKVAMRLCLPEGSDALWKSFPSKLRSQVRKPSKEGYIARIGGEEELDSFYSVFSANMRDLGTPVYGKKFFKEILSRFPKSTWLCTVYNRADKPVASGFLVEFRNTIEIPWASSLRTYNSHGPNMLLYWTVLQFACDRGAKVFDFGRSTPGEGTYQFKAQWGAAPIPLYWYYWVRGAGPLPEINPKNPKYRVAIEIWRRLPLMITRLVGPCIVRNLP